MRSVYSTVILLFICNFVTLKYLLKIRNRKKITTKSPRVEVKILFQMKYPMNDTVNIYFVPLRHKASTWVMPQGHKSSHNRFAP